MPRYYFEIETDDARVEDPEGALNPDDAAAMRGAERLADELTQEGLEFVGSTVQVLNDDRKVVADVLIRARKQLLQ